ncbi:MAG: pyruvate kinase [Oscillospiraceae bacterium]|nr:pyruvate kinase [Oscillospiraceae bacterium]
MRQTKIICTIGPACNNKETILKMIDAGMNVARFNMSHGNYDELEKTFAVVKDAIRESGKNVALLLDTKGPEVRIGHMEGGSAEIKEGQTFYLYRDETVGNSEGVSISYPKLIKKLKKDNITSGLKLLLDDGKITMEVTSVEDDKITCKVIVGGVLSSRKSINIPDYNINMPYVSAKDREDIAFGLKMGVNVIAASFVRNADDVRTLRDYIESIGGEHLGIISKIECQSGVDDIDNILDESDGIMVARGDMGVEIPFMELPEIQKALIFKTVLRGKFVITATQMLESMTTCPRPTRAEISDVANAVYDGTSAVMLSGESAAGMYPVESVKALSCICEEAEAHREFSNLESLIETYEVGKSLRQNLCASAKTIAENIGAKAIVVESATGHVPRIMAHYRPKCPIIAVVTDEEVCKKLCLYWGISSILGEEKKTIEEITAQSTQKALETGLVQKGDRVIVLTTSRTLKRGGADTLNIRDL